jgi:transcription elongation GreA/GreB family factor
MATLSTAIPERTQDLRERVEEALERLSRLLLEHAGAPGSAAGAEVERLRELARFLGQVVAGWPNVPAEALPAEGAGFGSTVTVLDERGERTSYTLMTGALVDIDAGQVSLASPIGHALIGAQPGDVVEVELPQRRRRFRVVAVRTLQDRLSEDLPGHDGLSDIPSLGILGDGARG